MADCGVGGWKRGSVDAVEGDTVELDIRDCCLNGPASWRYAVEGGGTGPFGNGGLRALGADIGKLPDACWPAC